MKRLFLILLAISLLIVNPATAQNGLIKRMANSVADDVLGKTGDSPKNNTSSQPEPGCACNPADLILDLGGKLNLMYSELSIDVLDDGSILLIDKISGKYYIAKDGTTKGPYSEGDPRIAPFVKSENGNDNDNTLALKYKDNITKSGEKYLIKFNGKTYGPYAQITSFAVTKSKDKFAALVTENIVVTEDLGKKMDQAIKNAKSEQEKMELAMKYAQELQQKMMAGGGPSSTLPKFITNIPDASYNPMTGGTFNADMKYDDILITGFDGVKDMKGNKIIEIKPEHSGQQIFVNSTNTGYAAYTYGTLNFSDGKTMSDLFNLYLMKNDGKVYLTYMYYSPAKNSILQCKVLY